MDYYGRNTVWGFRDRVLKNLSFLISQSEKGADVHVVTELVTSLLGLIVFPYEEIRRHRHVSFSEYKLDGLQNWPKWNFLVGSSDNLAELMRHLRNAISHRRVYFSSEDRDLALVNIQFSDCKRTGELYWQACMNGTQLQQFVIHLAALLSQWERDYS